MSDRRDPHVFSCESAATPQSLAMIRHRFASWLEEGVDGDRYEPTLRRDLVLAISELSWAALNASVERTSRPLEIRAWHEPEAIVMEVVEAAETVAAGKQSRAQNRDPLALSVLASLTDTLTVRRDEGHLLLRARKERPA
jgi:hypothetical protein